MERQKTKISLDDLCQIASKLTVNEGLTTIQYVRGKYNSVTLVLIDKIENQQVGSFSIDENRKVQSIQLPDDQIKNIQEIVDNHFKA